MNNAKYPLVFLLLTLASGCPTRPINDGTGGTGPGGAGNQGSGGRGGSTAGTSGSTATGTGGAAGAGATGGSSAGVTGAAGGTAGEGGAANAKGGTGGIAGHGQTGGSPGSGGSGGGIPTGGISGSGGKAAGGMAGTSATGGTAGTSATGGTAGAPGPCTGNAGCPGAFCNTTTHQCVASQCQDGTQDGAETDIDCGGGTCPACDVNKTCAADSDCRTRSCSHLYCALVSGPPNWLPGPSLNDGRGLVAVAVQPLTNGNMLMVAIGGEETSQDPYDPQVSTSFEVLDTSRTPLSWNAPLVLPSGYAGPAATDAAGTILTFLDTATWSYTGITGWQNLSTAMPTARTSAAAALGPNGLVYVVGGTGSGGSDSGAIEGYDPVANRWTTGLKPMPTPRANLGLATGNDGRLYAVGGGDASAGTVEAYDIGTNSWSAISALPNGASYPGVANAPDGRIYSVGGWTVNSSTANASNATNAYTPQTNRWTPVAPLTMARMGIGAAVSQDGHLYAVGGTANPEIPGVTLVEVYGPVPSVSPQAGAPGDSAAVSGSNFAANATVGVYFGSAAGTPIATGTTDGSGTLTAPVRFSVPNLPGGNQPLIVMDDRSQYPITLTFRVQ